MQRVPGAMPTPTRRRAPGLFGADPRSESSEAPEPLWRFLAPRYWRSWLLVIWLRAVVLLPWRWSLALHKRIGRMAGARSRKHARIVSENLKRCFPDLSEQERESIARDFHANMGAVLAEMAMAWFASPKRIRALCEVEGVENLERALEQGKGVILSTGHFTCLEICTPMLKDYVPRYTILYNKRRSRLLSEFQRRYRERYAHEAYTKENVRAIVRSLRGNAAIWYAADEAYLGKSAVLVPFFGEPAMTSTATSRLARISGAAVVPLSFHRKADGSGYLIELGRPLDKFPSGDTVADTRRLVELLEESIRAHPAQYFWNQKRFRGRPASVADA